MVSTLACVYPIAEVGRNPLIADYAFIGNDVRIGQDVLIWRGVDLSGNVIVKDGAVLGTQVAVVETAPGPWQ